MGAIQLIPVEKYIFVANMLGQQGIKRGSNGVPIRYEAVDECLQKLGTQALELGASVHMPRIGCGLAGGKWHKIEPLIQKNLTDRNIETIIYDFD